MKGRKTEQRTATLAGRDVAYTVTISPKATKARIRVGPGGVEVIIPRSAAPGRAAELLGEQSAWVLRQVDRVESMGPIPRHLRDPSEMGAFSGPMTQMVRIWPRRQATATKFPRLKMERAKRPTT